MRGLAGIGRRAKSNALGRGPRIVIRPDKLALVATSANPEPVWGIMLYSGSGDLINFRRSQLRCGSLLKRFISAKTSKSDYIIHIEKAADEEVISEQETSGGSSYSLR